MKALRLVLVVVLAGVLLSGRAAPAGDSDGSVVPAATATTLALPGDYTFHTERPDEPTMLHPIFEPDRRTLGFTVSSPTPTVRYFSARVHFACASVCTDAQLVLAQLRCEGRGVDARPVYSTTNWVPGGVAIVYARALVPLPAGTHRCGVWVGARRHAVGASGAMTVLGSPDGSKTILFERNADLAPGVALRSTCASASCDTYLGPGTAEPVALTALAGTWTAPAAATTFTVRADLEVDDCSRPARVPSDCPGVRDPLAMVAARSATVDSLLVVEQLTPSGEPCARAQTWPASGAFRRTTITSQQHHFKLIHGRDDLVIATDGRCASPARFSFQIELRFVAGNPMRIHDKTPDGSYSGILALANP